MPLGGIVLAHVQGLVLGGDPHHLGGRGGQVLARQVGGDELGLLLGKVHQGRQGLGQAHVEEVGHAGLHHPLVEGQAVLGVRDQFRVLEKRELHVVAGGVDDDVHVLDAVVGEAHLPALQGLDPRAEGDVAAARPGQELTADRRMGLQGLMVGLGQAIVLHGAQGLLDGLAGEGEAQLAGHPGRHGRLVRRTAVHVLGQDPDAPPRRDDQPARQGPLGQLRGDVHGRIAHAHHHHGLAADVHRIKGRAIGVGVKGHPVEMARIVRRPRAPVVAIADKENVVMPCFTCRKRDVPEAICIAHSAGHGGVEGDGLAQAEMVDIVVEVLQQLAVVRKVRPAGGHGIVLKGQTPLGRIDVQALVAGRVAVRVVVVPVAPNVVGHLEAVKRDAQVLEPLGGGEARAASTDDAGLGRLGHLESPIRFPFDFRSLGPIAPRSSLTRGQPGQIHVQSSHGVKCARRAKVLSLV